MLYYTLVFRELGRVPRPVTRAPVLEQFTPRVSVLFLFSLSNTAFAPISGVVVHSVVTNARLVARDCCPRAKTPRRSVGLGTELVTPRRHGGNILYRFYNNYVIILRIFFNNISLRSFY